MPSQTAMERKVLYAFRGWIAFIAFMDFGTAIRCYIERRSFLGDHMEAQFLEGSCPRAPGDIPGDSPSPSFSGDFTVSRILGMYCILKAIALVHCTLYIHYKPIVSMGGCGLALTMVLYFTEALYYRSSTFSFYVTFPCILNFITLAGLIYIPRRLRLWDPHADIDDENSQLLKQMGGFKKRRGPKKNCIS
ncbi:uncharacterized protein LOC129805518 isoform X1 [Phlebotomus papatasi]|uniref:uncharacterized protein LOC129805518 isoform X1 n=1 Tax=Phlebotomus papatasi TaxID=29031 RepID=UPI002484727E|nr:uncharacterized protein LOC129805518 isoform X1 [Phlebotomus papatasi]